MSALAKPKFLLVIDARGRVSQMTNDEEVLLGAVVSSRDLSEALQACSIAQMPVQVGSSLAFTLPVEIEGIRCGWHRRRHVDIDTPPTVDTGKVP
jgi:hypothetical protein